MKKISKYDRTKYYKVPVETWSAKACAKAANAIWRDGLGTPHHTKGLQCGRQSGPIRYNGGCIREGEFYYGECYTLPVLAKGYKWEMIPAWGWRIKRGDL